MKIPASFIQTVQKTFGERGRLFLNALPTLVQEAAERWDLRDLVPAESLSYNYIVFARRGDSDVVLKLGVPDRELTSEVRSLRQFAGRGAVQLLESDSGRGLLLLERLRPGEQLAALPDDRRATRIAAEVMLALRRPVPPETGLIQLSDWFAGLTRIRDRFKDGPGPLDHRLVERAHAVAAELLAEDRLPSLIHGDLHHFNILCSQRGWLAIDPKGVIGPAAFEVGPLLTNPWVVVGLPTDALSLTRDRIAILSEVLGFEPDRIRKWGLAYAVLSAVWSFEAHLEWQPAMECARILADLDS